MKYEIKYAIKKFEELFTNPNVKPTCIRQYVDDDGNVVEKEDTIKELFHQVVKVGDETFQGVVAFGTHGFTESSLDNMTAREFIEEYLIPNTVAINNAIERTLNPKETSDEIKKEVAKEFEEIKKKVKK